MARTQRAAFALHRSDVGFKRLGLSFAKHSLAGAQIGGRSRKFRQRDGFEAALFLGALNLAADRAEHRCPCQRGLGLRNGGSGLLFRLFGFLDGAREIGNRGERLQTGFSLSPRIAVA